MRARLSISSPTLPRGMSMTLVQGQEILIGSSSWADVQVQDVALSGKHFQLCVLPTECWLRDLKSPSGTFVNGTRIIATELCDGDIIQAGDTSITINLNLNTQPAKPAPKFFVSHKALRSSEVTILANELTQVKSSSFPALSLLSDYSKFGVYLAVPDLAEKVNESILKFNSAEDVRHQIIPVPRENLEKVLAESWNAAGTYWLIGKATDQTSHSMPNLGVKSSTVIRQMLQASPELLKQVFENYTAIVVKDDSETEGWFLFFQEDQSAVNTDSLSKRQRSHGSARLSTVA